MLRGAGDSGPALLPGTWTVGTLPFPGANYHKFAWVTDRPGGEGLMVSDGVAWDNCAKRVETFDGTTDASGNFSVVYSLPYATVPNVQPVTYPAADSTTRVRVTAASTTGFTVKTERNAGVSILGIDVLLLGTSNVPSVPVRVLVVES